MKALVGMIFLLALSGSTSVAATKDPQSPDREMLKMMEFLRQMEMIKQLDMMRDMHHLEEGGGAAGAQPSNPPVKKPETTK